jgi:hypothetical protein
MALGPRAKAALMIQLNEARELSYGPKLTLCRETLSNPSSFTPTEPFHYSFFVKKRRIFNTVLFI